MDGLEVAVGEEGGELEASLDVLRLLDLDPSALNLHRHTENVLSACRHNVADLRGEEER